MEIPKKIQDEIQYYCKINNIEDIDKFLVKIIRDGFNIAKYGNGPTNIVIAPKEEIEIKPISLNVPDSLKNIIENNKTEEVEKKILDIVKVPKELIENKKKDLYDEE